MCLLITKLLLCPAKNEHLFSFIFGGLYFARSGQRGRHDGRKGHATAVGQLQGHGGLLWRRHHQDTIAQEKASHCQMFQSGYARA